MHKLKKLKTKSCVRLIHSLLFIFSLMIDSSPSLIKQQNAWSQGSSKYQNQKKCTCSEISINLSFYVYIIPKKKQLFFIFKLKKRKMATILKQAIKNISSYFLFIKQIVNKVEKNVSKKHLKIPKRFSEAIVFENCLKD